MEDVRARGDAAVREYTAKFDRVQMEAVCTPIEVRRHGAARLPGSAWVSAAGLLLFTLPLLPLHCCVCCCLITPAACYVWSPLQALPVQVLQLTTIALLPPPAGAARAPAGRRDASGL